MDIKVQKSKIEGNVAVPGSKSHTIRALAIASAADGESVIRQPLISEDTLAGKIAAESLGAEIKCEDTLWRVRGTGGRFVCKDSIIDMRNSGTSLRIFTALAALADFSVTFDGDSSLRTRPMIPLLSALSGLGVYCSDTDGCCPVTVKGPVKGGKTIVDGTSSQFLTALLIALPLAADDSYIKVKNLNEVPYIEMTLDWLCRGGIELEYPEGMDHFKIKGRQKYPAFDITVPADFSTAAFPLAAAALTGGRVEILNLDFDDHQGDKAVFDYMEQMGANIDKTAAGTVVSATGRLRGASFDLNATPDALPVMAVAGALAEGTTELLNCPQARIKETDRIKCMACELRRMGAEVKELDDGMVITGTNVLRGTEVESYGDHRIAMALTIAGMCASGETIIKGADCAAVTYPAFAEDFRKLHSEIRTC